MESFNVKIIHPTNNSDIDVGIPKDTLLSDVFSQLIEANFLSAGQSYSGVLKNYYNKSLDNDRTVDENGIRHDDIILIVLSTKAGGIDMPGLWQEFYPYLDQIGTVLGITSAAIGFGAWVKNKFEKTHSPKKFSEIITDKELWNLHELAIKLDITDEESKNLLKGYGYKWDKRYSLHYKTDKTIEIIEKFKDAIY